MAQIKKLKSKRLMRSITNIGATKANSINALPNQRRAGRTQPIGPNAGKLPCVPERSVRSLDEPHGADGVGRQVEAGCDTTAFRQDVTGAVDRDVVDHKG